MEFTPKIFGIGLPWTGQAMLCEALKKLGYRAVHDPGDVRTWNQVRHNDAAFELLADYDAMTGLPVSMIPALDRTWPRSKFIMTTRNLEKWTAKAVEAAAQLPSPRQDMPRPVAVDDLLRKCGQPPSSAALIAYCRTCLQTAAVYFKGAEKDFCMIRICDEQPEGWAELCAFLGQEKGKGGFPRCKCKGIDAMCRAG